MQVDTSRNLEDIKAELRKHGSQFEDQKRLIADSNRMIESLKRRLDKIGSQSEENSQTKPNTQ